MLMTHNTSGINTEIKVNGQKLGTVTSFKYLSSVITDEDEGICDDDDDYSYSVSVPPRVTAVARKRPQSFCQKCRWHVTHKHAYTLDPTKSEWADYAAVQA